MENKTTDRSTAPGAAVYSNWFLVLYNILVLNLYSPIAWGCPSTTLMRFFNRNVNRESKRILDIGVGTGYYLERASLSSGAKVSLVDLNRNCLDIASSRIKRAHPGVTTLQVEGDFFDPNLMSKTGSDNSFDAISMTYLLHCLPGPPSRKSDAMIRLSRLLQRDGVLFGATILGKGVTHNYLGQFIMFWHNLLGIFDNAADSKESFLGPLHEAFKDVRWELHGRVLVFEAREPVRGSG